MATVACVSCGLPRSEELIDAACPVCGQLGSEKPPAAETEPPKGTLYHYPNPYNHQVLSIAASPAPPKIAQQIYTQAILTKMCLRYHQGETMEKTLAWAEGECEGYMRS